jgi:hypothetical protein
MRQFFDILFLLAFIASSLLPAGFMVRSTTEDGLTAPQIEIVICTAHGAKQVVLDLLEGGVGKTPDPKPESDCPYQTLGNGGILASAAELRNVAWHAAVQHRITTEIFRVTPKPRDFSARAPPVFQS